MNSDNDIAKAELKKILTAGIKDYNEAVSEHKVHEASPSSPGLGN